MKNGKTVSHEIAEVASVYSPLWKYLHSTHKL
jgi:hypothetical protein